MNLNELPRDLAQFVQQATAQGKYQSAEEVISVALSLLREQEVQSGNGQSSANGYPDALPRSAEEIVAAITKALASGHHACARQLAIDGAKQYPYHDELQKYGRILAPPTVGKPMPTTPKARTALKANNAWPRAHWHELVVAGLRYMLVTCSMYRPHLTTLLPMSVMCTDATSC